MTTTWSKFFSLGDIPIEVVSELPFEEETFHPNIRLFEVPPVASPLVRLEHRFHLPRLDRDELGTKVYDDLPWRVFRKGATWTYLGITPRSGPDEFVYAAIFDEEHRLGKIHHLDEKAFRAGGLRSLTMFTTDQVFLARTLSLLDGFYLHSAGLVIEERGYLFAGSSGAGKSTISTLLQPFGRILCDDRIVLRGNGGGFRMYGSWSYGDVPEVSAESRPLEALFFLKQGSANRTEPIEDGKDKVARLMSCLVRPMTDRGWWQRATEQIDALARAVPCHVLEFSKDRPAEELVEIVTGGLGR